MWSVCCIFCELFTQKPLFPGKSEIDQTKRNLKDLGSPSEKIRPGYSDLPAGKQTTFTEHPYNILRRRFGALLSNQGFDLINKTLTYCPSSMERGAQAPDSLSEGQATARWDEDQGQATARWDEDQGQATARWDEDLKDTDFHLPVGQATARCDEDLKKASKKKTGRLKINRARHLQKREKE